MTLTQTPKCPNCVGWKATIQARLKSQQKFITMAILRRLKQLIFLKKNCNVKVTLNSDNTLTILIRGEYNSTLQNKSFSVSEDSHIIKCDCYTFDKDAQSMRYYESGSNYFNDGWSMQWTYTLFEAYKDF